MDEVKAKMIKRMALHYILSKHVTFRDLAKKYEVSSSTVSKYMNKDLKDICPWLLEKVQRKKEKVILKNRSQFIKK